MLFFRLNIYAVVIANAFFGLVMCILNAKSLQKYSRYTQEIQKTFIIPAISSAIMGAAAYGSYQLFYSLVNNNLASLVISILIAMFTYAIVLLLLKGLSEEDMYRFPKGDLLVSIAKKLHLLKD